MELHFANVDTIQIYLPSPRHFLNTPTRTSHSFRYSISLPTPKTPFRYLLPLSSRVSSLSLWYRPPSRSLGTRPRCRNYTHTWLAWRRTRTAVCKILAFKGTRHCCGRNSRGNSSGNSAVKPSALSWTFFVPPYLVRTVNPLYGVEQQVFAQMLA